MFYKYVKNYGHFGLQRFQNFVRQLLHANSGRLLPARETQVGEDSNVAAANMMITFFISG